MASPDKLLRMRITKICFQCIYVRVSVLFSCRPAGPPCVLLIYSTAYHTRPALTKCLPAGSDITRNFIQEQISSDVDLSEELDATAIVLLVIQLILTAVGLSCYRARAGAASAPVPTMGLHALGAVSTGYNGPTNPPSAFG